MKAFLLTLLICGGILVGHAQTQPITAYKAILTTNSGKLKGILYKVDTAGIILNIDGRFQAVKLADIQTVKIRMTKKRFQGKNYMKNDSPTEYHLNADGKMVDQYGIEAPSLETEVLASGFSVFFNGLFNAIAWPIYAINPSIAKFNLEGKKDPDQLSQLDYYSIQYQSNPIKHLADLKKLKDISDKAKQ